MENPVKSRKALVICSVWWFYPSFSFSPLDYNEVVTAVQNKILCIKVFFFFKWPHHFLRINFSVHPQLLHVLKHIFFKGSGCLTLPFLKILLECDKNLFTVLKFFLLLMMYASILSMKLTTLNPLTDFSFLPVFPEDSAVLCQSFDITLVGSHPMLSSFFALTSS